MQIRVVELIEPRLRRDIHEKLRRAPQDHVRTPRQGHDRHPGQKRLFFEQGLECDHLEALGHLRGLEVAQERSGDFEHTKLIDAEAALASYEVEPAAMAISDTTHATSHPMQLASGW